MSWLWLDSLPISIRYHQSKILNHPLYLTHIENQDIKRHVLTLNALLSGRPNAVPRLISVATPACGLFRPCIPLLTQRRSLANEWYSHKTTY